MPDYPNMYSHTGGSYKAKSPNKTWGDYTGMHQQNDILSSRQTQGDLK